MSKKIVNPSSVTSEELFKLFQGQTQFKSQRFLFGVQLESFEEFHTKDNETQEKNLNLPNLQINEIKTREIKEELSFESETVAR